jgi:radical SAM protein with 4Fe4S-binding SPASM domain
MSFSNFKKIAQNLPSSVETVHLYLSGEPLINDECFHMVSFLSDRNLKSSISTNGTLLGKRIEEILDSQLSELIIGVDGATEETYRKYRVGGNFTTLIDNIRKLVQAKKQRGQLYPSIVLQYIVMKHTEKEIDLAIQMAKDLKVDALSLISVSLGTHHNSDNERKRLASTYLPEDSSFSRYEADHTGKLNNKWRHNFCPLWREPVILWNGDITACCFDHNGLEVYGNVLTRNFGEIWQSKKHLQVVQKILHRKMKICRTCGICSGDEHKYLTF